MTEIYGDSETERRAEYYYQPQILEGTFRYIYHKVQQKRAELESALGIKNNWSNMSDVSPSNNQGFMDTKSTILFILTSCAVLLLADLCAFIVFVSDLDWGRHKLNTKVNKSALVIHQWTMLPYPSLYCYIV